MAERVDDWLAALEPRDLPILRSSADALAGIARNDPEDVGVRDLKPLITRDPALTIDLIRAANARRPRHLDERITTVEQAIMLLGLSRTVQITHALPVCDQSLGEPALAAYRRNLAEAYFAARHAERWAEIRHDVLPAELYSAALARHVALLAIRAATDNPLEAVDELVERGAIARPTAEYIVLGFTTQELSLGLSEAWRLPSLAIEYILLDKLTSRRALGISLGQRFSELAPHGWQTRPMHRLLGTVSNYLGLTREEAEAEVHASSDRIIREHQFGVDPPFTALADSGSVQPAPMDARAGACLLPQAPLLQRLLAELHADRLERIEHELRLSHEQIDALDPPLTLAMRALHHGAALNRVVFFRMNRDGDRLKPYAIAGVAPDPQLLITLLPLTPEQLTRLLPADRHVTHVTEEREPQLREALRDAGGEVFGGSEWLVTSVQAHGAPVGLLLAERTPPECLLDRAAAQAFAEVTRALEGALDRRLKPRGGRQ